MIIVLIIGFIIFIISLIARIWYKENISFLLGILGAWLMSVAIMNMDMNNKPSAMDVYQGKTTLEITYRNNIPVDSVVVFKDK